MEELAAHIAIAKTVERKFTLIDDFQQSGIWWAPGIESTVAPSVSHHWFAGLFDTAKQRDRSAGGSQRMKIALIGSVGDVTSTRKISQTPAQRAPAFFFLGTTLR